MPHFITRDEREAIVRIALMNNNSVYDVEFEGSARVFTMRLISTLSRDELIAILTEMAEYVSEYNAQYEILNGLCQELEILPSDETSLIDLIKLKTVLNELFSKAELYELIFDLQGRLKSDGLKITLDYENLAGDGSKKSVAQNLILFMQRRALLDILVESIKIARPHADIYHS